MDTDQKSSTAEKIRLFEAKKAALMTMGGEKLIQKQHSSGKLTARERLDTLFDTGDVPGGSALREAPLHALRAGREGDPRRRRRHRLRDDQRPDRLCRRPGLHQRRREPRGDARKKDLEGDGYGGRRPEALHLDQRLRRRPDPGGGPFAGGVWRHLLPQFNRLGLHPPDHGDHGTHGGRRGLLPRPDGLDLHGQEEQLHVHHRPRGDQGGHRRRRSARRSWAAPWPTPPRAASAILRRRATRTASRRSGRFSPSCPTVATAPCPLFRPKTIPSGSVPNSTRSSPTGQTAPTT